MKGGMSNWGGRERGNERCRGRRAAEGAAAKPGEAGGMAVGPPCVPVPLVPHGPLFLRTASAACFTCKTHPAERASMRGAKGSRRKAFLRRCREKREAGILHSLAPPDEATGGCGNEG